MYLLKIPKRVRWLQFDISNLDQYIEKREKKRYMRLIWHEIVGQKQSVKDLFKV